ncbi:unnamed protein product, partial [Ectocarpus sp. 8 AP-2014]
ATARSATIARASCPENADRARASSPAKDPVPARAARKTPTTSTPGIVDPPSAGGGAPTNPVAGVVATFGSGAACSMTGMHRTVDDTPHGSGEPATAAVPLRPPLKPRRSAVGQTTSMQTGLADWAATPTVPSPRCSLWGTSNSARAAAAAAAADDPGRAVAPESLALLPVSPARTAATRTAMAGEFPTTSNREAERRPNVRMATVQASWPRAATPDPREYGGGAAHTSTKRSSRSRVPPLLSAVAAVAVAVPSPPVPWPLSSGGRGTHSRPDCAPSFSGRPGGCCSTAGVCCCVEEEGI